MEKRKNKTESISEKLLANNFLKLTKDFNPPIQESLQISSKKKKHTHKKSHTLVHQRKAAEHQSHRI